jgi:hypothetical protein
MPALLFPFEVGGLIDHAKDSPLVCITRPIFKYCKHNRTGRSIRDVGPFPDGELTSAFERLETVMKAVGLDCRKFRRRFDLDGVRLLQR